MKIDMKMKMLLAGVMWPLEVMRVTVVIEEYKAIGVAIVFCVLWSYVEILLMKIMRYGPSGDMEDCGRGKKNWLVTMRRKSCQGLPPSQAMQHEKLMRPDKHF